MISFNGETCEYDALGNPTLYRGKKLDWTKVRRLASYDDGAVTFEYGEKGIRYKKNNTEYTLDGNMILRECDGTKTLTVSYSGDTLPHFVEWKSMASGDYAVGLEPCTTELDDRFAYQTVKAQEQISFSATITVSSR